MNILTSCCGGGAKVPEAYTKAEDLFKDGQLDDDAFRLAFKIRDMEYGTRLFRLLANNRTSMDIRMFATSLAQFNMETRQGKAEFAFGLYTYDGKLVDKADLEGALDRALNENAKHGAVTKNKREAIGEVLDFAEAEYGDSLTLSQFAQVARKFPLLLSPAFDIWMSMEEYHKACATMVLQNGWAQEAAGGAGKRPRRRSSEAAEPLASPRGSAPRDAESPLPSPRRKSSRKSGTEAPGPPLEPRKSLRQSIREKRGSKITNDAAHEMDKWKERLNKRQNRTSKGSAVDPGPDESVGNNFSPFKVHPSGGDGSGGSEAPGGLLGQMQRSFRRASSTVQGMAQGLGRASGGAEYEDEESGRTVPPFTSKSGADFGGGRRSLKAWSTPDNSPRDVPAGRRTSLTDSFKALQGMLTGGTEDNISMRDLGPPEDHNERKRQSSIAGNGGITPRSAQDRRSRKKLIAPMRASDRADNSEKQFGRANSGRGSVLTKIDSIKRDKRARASKKM